MSLLLGLALVAMILYWIGGEKWAHTLFRDWGVPACIVTGLMLGCGGHWSLVLVFLGCWLGLALGDYGKWHWAIHAFVFALATGFYAWFTGYWLAFAVCLVTFPALTYIWSRWIKFGDVFQRGFTFGIAPIIFKIFN